MDGFLNLDLLSVGIAVAGIGLLGFVILFHNPRSATNRAFFYFAGITVFWSIFNYVSYQLPAGDLAFWLLRGVMFFAVWHAYTFYHLTTVFPDEHYLESRWGMYVLIPVVGTVSILALTPYVFERVTSVTASGTIYGLQPGIAMPLFGIVVFYLIATAIWRLVRNTMRAPKGERQPYTMVIIGMAITFTFLLTFNFILPAAFNESGFVPLGALFLLPFVALTSYAIYKHHLFNLKVATTAFLGFMVTVFSFVNILYSTSASAIAINIAAFLVVLLGSVRIVQDTLSLRQLTEELKETNERQEGLIHFIGHEVKGYLTKAQGVFSLLVDGDLGELSETMKPFVVRALQDAEDGVTSVSDILKASNLKRGTTTFKKEPFDLKELVQDSVEKARQAAEVKGLTLAFTAPEGAFAMMGDRGEIGDHVLRNLIDNAVNYTPTGSITVSLQKVEGKYVFSVKDTGVGITDEDKAHLFTEGGHGKDSQKVNVNSTGYGLFIAKQVTEAHGGTIRAESEGAEKGSTFIVELPA